MASRCPHRSSKQTDRVRAYCACNTARTTGGGTGARGSWVCRKEATPRTLAHGGLGRPGQVPQALIGALPAGAHLASPARAKGLRVPLAQRQDGSLPGGLWGFPFRPSRPLRGSAPPRSPSTFPYGPRYCLY